MGQKLYGNLSDDAAHDLQNGITMLRNDLKLNIFMQQRVDVDQIAEDSTTKKVLLALEKLLSRFEYSADQSAEQLQQMESQDSHGGFPKLIAIRNLLQKHHSPETKHAPVHQEFIPDYRQRKPFLADTDDDNTKRTEPKWAETYSQASVDLASRYLRFPEEPGRILSLRDDVGDFHEVLAKLLRRNSGQPRKEQDYEDEDLEAIQRAYDFATTCASLFGQIVSSTKCKREHKAKLHMSGFKQHQLNMAINSCQATDWVPVLFTHASEKPSSGSICCNNICSPASTCLEISQPRHIAFNSNGMWEYVNGCAGVNSATYLMKGHETALEHFLTYRDQLNPVHRKLIVVLLAASLCQLSKSPWIAQQLGTHTVFVPSPDSDAPLDQWCPRIGCTLIKQDYAEMSSEDIAAFGVLVLELEANRKAEWAPEDFDFETGKPSNHVRLLRILTAWEDFICDDYREIGWACARFAKLVECLDQPIETDRKALAIIYKRIYLPLLRHSTTAFGKLKGLFEGLFSSGLDVAARVRVPEIVIEERYLFDDGDQLPNPEDRESARKFLHNLKHLFGRIGDFHEDSHWANASEPKRIRVAVLDSGIDQKDPMILGAIREGRINRTESRDFVNPKDQSLQDAHGHGTHVTRLLLNVAQAAEIYIGRVFAKSTLNDELMNGIAEAINWAVEDCDAHVISMSFGFDAKNESIERALDKATSAGKLLFAAASNNGGISGRARPARHHGVICIHASDGNGNKGGMNPTPETNKHNFATLGVAVPSKWRKEEVWKTGTSFATPIAAGFAANILQFAQDECNGVTESNKEKLSEKSGMEAMFQAMSHKRDDYEFVHPGGLWENWRVENTKRGDKSELKVGERINDIMDKI